MKMIPVKCQEPGEDGCSKAYEGCKKRIMYGEARFKVICDKGELSVKESSGLGSSAGK